MLENGAVSGVQDFIGWMLVCIDKSWLAGRRRVVVKEKGDGRGVLLLLVCMAQVAWS